MGAKEGPLMSLRSQVLREAARWARLAEFWAARGRDDLARAYRLRTETLGREAEMID